MSANKSEKPAFRPVEIDSLDARLAKRAIEKGIPTLMMPEREAEVEQGAVANPKSPPSAKSKSDPEADKAKEERVMTLNLEVPPYVWIAVKTRAAQQMMSMRFFMLSALKAQGVEIDDADLHEDGRRLRGSRRRSFANRLSNP